jgi:hypothetical protein
MLRSIFSKSKQSHRCCYSFCRLLKEDLSSIKRGQGVPLLLYFLLLLFVCLPAKTKQKHFLLLYFSRVCVKREKEEKRIPMFSFFLTLSLSHTHTHTVLSLTLPNTFSLSHTHTLSHTLTLSLTHFVSLTHTLSLSHSS